jgi:hypothetical protein
MTASFLGTLRSIMIVDDYESILYSLVEVFEGANSTVHSVVSVESTVKPLDDEYAAVGKIGFSGEELGDILMQVIPDTNTVSRFRSRWNPAVLKLRMCLHTDAICNSKLSQTVRVIAEPSIREQLGGQEFDAGSRPKNPDGLADNQVVCLSDRATTDNQREL